MALDTVGYETHFGSEIVRRQATEEQIFFNLRKLLQRFYFQLFLHLYHIAIGGEVQPVSVEYGQMHVHFLRHPDSPQQRLPGGIGKVDRTQNGPGPGCRICVRVVHMTKITGCVRAYSGF
jgi:hypothetical protein